MKTIEINNKVFKVVNTKTKAGEHIRHIALTKCNTYYYYTDIDNAYGRCSNTKREIWDSWKKWFDEIKGTNKDIWISSKNTWQFTIGFKFTSPTGHTFNGIITKARNEVVIYE